MPPSSSAPIGAGPWIAALIVWLAVGYGLLADPAAKPVTERGFILASCR